MNHIQIIFKVLIIQIPLALGVLLMFPLGTNRLQVLPPKIGLILLQVFGSSHTYRANGDTLIICFTTSMVIYKSVYLAQFCACTRSFLVVDG